MLEQRFAEVYTKFKISFYSKVFKQFDDKEGLSAVEVFCVEVIYALGRPTINEFATFARVSLPNANYKINSLVRKGYVTKTQSTEDKREYILDVTEKYMEDYGVTYGYINTVMQRIRDRLTEEQVDQLDQLLQVISDDLMPEVKVTKTMNMLKAERIGSDGNGYNSNRSGNSGKRDEE